MVACPGNESLKDCSTVLLADENDDYVDDVGIGGWLDTGST